MSKQRRNGVARSLGGDIFITVVLIVVAAFMMLPFVYAIMQSNTQQLSDPFQADR